ncbi:MAG: hypothetical protein U0326_22925 [Polyangiales bacterium]
MRLTWCSLLGVTMVLGCGDDATTPPATPVPSFPDRAVGAREAFRPACDASRGIFCALPWPSNALTAVDGASATGLRVSLPPSVVAPGDDAREINRADGFSRLSPVMFGVEGEVDMASLGATTGGSVRLYAVRADHTLAPVPLRYRLVAGTGVSPETLVIAYPRVPLAAATDHVAVVLDGLRTTTAPLRADALTRAATGVAAPATEEQSRARAYFAPTVAMLRTAGVDTAHVARVWDFTTRSEDQPRAALRVMRARLFAAVDAGTVGVEIDRVRARTTGPSAVEVLGHLTNVPDFVDADGRLARDAMGGPRVADGAEGIHTVPFRVLVPSGTGDYRVAMWGHGTGGDESDDSFDDEITGNGAAKVNIRFAGWWGSEVLNTFASFSHMLLGVERSTAGLLQSVADGQALFRALVGSGDDTSHTALLARVLAAPMLDDMVNPVAGRYPRAQGAIWTGGSLGGTMGLVFTRSEPRMIAGVLNVPGAAWSHFITGSSLYPAARLALLNSYPSGDYEIHIAVGMSQLNFDEVDGATWGGANPERPMLFQESMGDPVLPNIGTEMAAASARASQVGVVLAELPDAPRVNEVTSGSALTQFKVPSTVIGPYNVHGFAARGSPAGVAAREQIVGFIRSLWAGSMRVTIPSGCAMNTPPGSCDFSSAR